MVQRDWLTLSDDEYEKLKREVYSLRTEVVQLAKELGKPLPAFCR